jgi:hypothetical protein
MGREGSTVMSLDEFTSFQNIFGLNFSEIFYLKLKVFYRMFALSYGIINTMNIGEDFNVVSMTGDNVLCYCDYHGFWYWCTEQSQRNCNRVTTRNDIYNSLGCDVQVYNTTTLTPGNKFENMTSNTGRRTRFFGSFHRPVNWKTVRNTLLYASVPFCIIILVIGVKIMKVIRRRRRSGAESPNSSLYSEVNTSDHV